MPRTASTDTNNADNDFILVVNAGDPQYYSRVAKTAFNPPTSYEATGIDKLHAGNKLPGYSIKIALIDSGIDYKHLAFVKQYPQRKPRFGHDTDFVPASHASAQAPFDCNGSGTKMAGLLAAATGTFKGIAPGATLGIYRVYGCNRKISPERILSALKKATQDGMDIIVLPTIASSHAYAPLLRQAIVDAAAKNSVVIAPVGHDDTKLNDAVSLADAPLIAVGAADARHYLAHSLWLEDAPNVRIPYRKDLSFRQNIEGKLALVMSSGLGIAAITKAAQAAGAKGYDNSHATSRVARMHGNELELDVVAPGIQLFTTHRTGQSGQSYGYYSSPSAAAAYTAGVVALFMQEHGRRKLHVETIKALLRNSARPLASRASGQLESVFRQGAGLLSAYDFVHIETIAMPAAIPLAMAASFLLGYMFDCDEQ
ncbi:peptidase S8/S53 domain-containing protein [Syncephalis pseudoplumigaleata]|uniref:Peptidase S8/S53 domain-containing protein n=1 Tax=Syncephalis pseudoplumigaleata TaxID=1712513 RepID=A0A4P9YUD9_9FUNG|nr:peptidase S8/S53 domain-containing protein [Syncephalis pseudoplumigaleata]|eukprot:RKP23368.1 peptidase S8/S53 domain-containing protein [Syncephalis pseudoplumigaleata]